MTEDQELISTIYAGWEVFQGALSRAIIPLSDRQLTLRAAPNLRSVAEIAVHIVGAPARWFYLLMMKYCMVV